VSSPRGPRLPKRPSPSSGERRLQTRAYEGAFEAVIAIIAAVGLGYWADTYLDSSPIGLIVGAVIGFAAMVLRLLRLGKELGISEPSDEQGNGRED
jgi:F0F1-type ATP synthase assembly protein I